jgi:hypothetical protein
MAPSASIDATSMEEDCETPEAHWLDQPGDSAEGFNTQAFDALAVHADLTVLFVLTAAPMLLNILSDKAQDVEELPPTDY